MAEQRQRGLEYLALLPLILTLIGSAPPSALLHPGDIVYVRVWNHPELSKQVTVDADGAVRVPLSGVVQVSGLGEAAAGRRIADSLTAYVPHCAVTVETIEQVKTIFIAGGPGGTLKYQPGETLAAAVADATEVTSATSQSFNQSGQITGRTDDLTAALRSRINFKRVAIQRDGAALGPYDVAAFNVTGDPGPLLHPGDTVVFQYKPIHVQVSGDVAVPGTTYLSAEQSISEAISQAGGLLPTAAFNHILLSRGSETRSLALGDAMLTQPAKTGDILTIPEAPRINVVGTVASPGVVVLRTDSSLLSALYTAGGPTKFANLRNVQVIRNAMNSSYDVARLTHGDITQNPILLDGDTVVVPEGHKVDFSGIFNVLGGIAAGLASHVPL